MELKDSIKKKAEINDNDKKAELIEIMKNSEELLNYLKRCEIEVENLKKDNDKKKEGIKSKNNTELFDIIISELKDYLKAQNRTNEIIEEKKN